MRTHEDVAQATSGLGVQRADCRGRVVLRSRLMERVVGRLVNRVVSRLVERSVMACRNAQRGDSEVGREVMATRCGRVRLTDRAGGHRPRELLLRV